MGKQKSRDGFTVRDRRSGFAIIDNIVIDDYGPLIGAYGIAAYCILVRFARPDGTDSYPSYQRVASLMGASRSTAIRAIKKLVDLHLIEKEKRRSKGESLSNAYALIDITRLQTSQVVGSSPLTPPSSPLTPPSSPLTPGSVTDTPDQDTNNKTPITRHLINDDDDDGFSFLVKADGRDRADREAIRKTDPEWLGVRLAANLMVADTLGASSWDGWEAYRDSLSTHQLRLLCYWCQKINIAYLSDDEDAITNPVGLVRHGVDKNLSPALRPIDEETIDKFIQAQIEGAPESEYYE